MALKNWTKASIDDVVNLIIDYRGKTPKKLGGDWQESGIPAISAKNIKQGQIVQQESIKYVSHEMYQIWMKDKLQPNDVILTSEAPLGEILYLKKVEPMVLSQRLFALRLDTLTINPRYFAYYLESEEGQSALKSRATGTTAQGIRQSLLREVDVYFPDNLATQQKIASILSAYDDLIENNNRRIQILEEMAQRIYREWFVHFRFPGHENVKMVDSKLGKIPEGWEVGRVKDFGVIVTGTTPSKKHPENFGVNMPFVKPPDLRKGMFTLETDESLSSTGVNVQPTKTIPAGAICVSCIGTAGLVSITSNKVHTNQQINSIIPNQDFYQEFLYFSMLDLKETINNYGATGATMVNLSKGKFETLKLIFPITQILKEFNLLTSDIFCEILALTKQTQALRKTRDLLLPRLISGRLDVEDLDIAG